MSDYVWGNEETKFFFELSPEIILDTVTTHKIDVTGRCLQLNSMENRVYEVELDNPEDFNLTNNSVIPKFYRPGRWTKEQIKEEHQFMLDLQSAEIPVIAPLVFDGETLFQCPKTKLFYTLFPKKGGRAPDEMNTEQLEIIGRMLARLHNVGEQKQAEHRIKISPDTFGKQNLKYLMDNQIIPLHLESQYQKAVEEICELAAPLFKETKMIRIHGDCHCGNIISRDSEGLFFIDFDDMLVGPAVQDIWLITPGVDEYAKQDRAILLEAYRGMRNFDAKELKLVEILRSLRFIHFSAWIAKRWNDPAFKKAFTYFDEPQYWQTQVNDLERQKVLIQNDLQRDYLC